MLDNEIGTPLVVYRLAKRRFQLFGDVEIVENGHRTIVTFYDVLLVGGYQTNIVLHLIVDVVVVDVNAVIGGVEDVAQQCYGTTGFLETQLGSLGGLLGLGDTIFPALHQHLHLCVQLRHTLAFGRCTNNNTEVLGADALNKLFQTGTFLAFLDFRRNRDLIPKGH